MLSALGRVSDSKRKIFLCNSTKSLTSCSMGLGISRTFVDEPSANIRNVVVCLGYWNPTELC